MNHTNDNALDAYENFHSLRFERPLDGVLKMRIESGRRFNALTEQAHHELEEVWAVIDRDPLTRVTVITGSDDAFCAGADLRWISEDQPGQSRWATSVDHWIHATRLVNAMLDARKPIVSAINGAAVGGGLCVALLADISIAARTARLIDGHVKLGVAAGDHALIVWPLLCGMAKAKLHLLANRPLDGAEAERIGLVSLAVDAQALQESALEVAASLAGAPPTALRMTRYCLNLWMKQFGPIMDLSAAMELWGFNGEEMREGVAAVLEKRVPKFSKDSPFR